MRLLILLLAILSFSGCTRRTHSVLYTEPYPPKGQNSKIDVYNTLAPTRPYREIGEIEVRSNGAKSIKKILLVARRMGADGVILQGPAGTQGSAYAVTDRVVVGRSHSYGKTAVAIVYTDQ